ncbi:hypothetical protein ANO11243_047870 [Dothideomycetidae sp. 11243]|nr:hypothetical protein ANO11243_047870 [fungal sp. No.11243]
MSAEKENKPEGKTDSNFTTGEQKLLLSILAHLQGEIAVSPPHHILTFKLTLVETDWNGVAAECGYKDSSIAKIRWRQIRNKKIPSLGSTKTVNSPAKKESQDSYGEIKQGKKRGRPIKKAKLEDMPLKDAADSDLEA